MFLTKSLVAYYKRMECNNGLNEDVDIDNDSPWLFYEISQEQANCVSMVANPNNNVINKHVTIECPTLSSLYIPIEHSTLVSPRVDDMVINIQLLYNLNALMKSKL